MNKTFNAGLFNQSYKNFIGHNLWILKPSGFNRGVGIHLFSSIEQLERLITDYCYGIEDKPILIKPKNTKDINKQMQQSLIFKQNCQNQQKQEKTRLFSSQLIPQIIKIQTFVIQKYLESPLLINNRKFDMRVWALVNHKMELYWFKEGYLRTSSEQFDLDIEKVDNQFIHLTNNAIQKLSENYGQIEDGNQLSFQYLMNYMNKSQEEFDLIIKQPIKCCIIQTMDCIKQKLNKKNRQFCFEIYGFDFIIDQNEQVFLIEVNTNPCLEESSGILKQLVPRMLNDAFKLTLDQIFPLKNQAEIIYKVDGYDNQENMWEFLSYLKVKDENKKQTHKNLFF